MARRQRAPWRGSRPRDVTCRTRTLATPGADATTSGEDRPGKDMPPR